MGDDLYIEVTVTGTEGAEFDLLDQVLGMSTDDKGTACLPNSPYPSTLDFENDHILWQNRTIISGQAVFSYTCTLTSSSGGDNANDLPEVVVGQTTLTYLHTPIGLPSYSLEYYGGVGGNEAIINYSTADEVRLGFDSDALKDTGCFTDSSKECFTLTPPDTMFSVIHGRSYVGNAPVSDSAALVYPPKVIIGDTYNIDSNIFYYFGRNLQQSSTPNSCSDSECASWVVSESEIVDGVQSYYNHDPGFLANLTDNLSGEAEVITSPNNSLRDGQHWHLTAKDVGDFNTKNSRNYPDGKAWKVEGDLEIDNPFSRLNHKYSGIGTIFVGGDLTIKEDILPKSQNQDFLGFIVSGDVKIQDGADVNAAIICEGILATSGPSRVQLTGSFIAQGFDFGTVGSIIQYRSQLENHWPPGFRYINMPIPEKSH